MNVKSNGRENLAADMAFDRWRAETADDQAWTAEMRTKSVLPLVNHWSVVGSSLLEWAFRAGYDARDQELARAREVEQTG